MTPVRRYLQSRAVHAPWSLSHAVDGSGLRQVVVIPALAEHDRLFLTLQDLAANAGDAREQTLVICVVNNRVPAVAGAEDCADNQRTLAALPEFAEAQPELRLAWIDAASAGRELGPKEGVGLARKIGLDAGLALLEQAGHPEGALICLDADTRVPENYLEAIDAYFAADTRWAAAIAYAHPLDGPSNEVSPILSYELFLRYQELAWRHAGSPYAYPAIGSAMACTGVAYATAGGMNRRRAGEDFYFLQQLAKTGEVGRIWDTCVVPSGRASHRVPFGTGRKVGAYHDDPDSAYRTYHPESYQILKAWLAVAAGPLDESGVELLDRARAIAPELSTFLEVQGLAGAWDNIRRQGTGEEQRRRQFHQWFDAFRTLKFIHHLRDNGLPLQDLFESLACVMAWNGLEGDCDFGAALRHDPEGQRELLHRLRAWRP